MMISKQSFSIYYWLCLSLLLVIVVFIQPVKTFRPQVSLSLRPFANKLSFRSKATINNHHHHSKQGQDLLLSLFASPKNSKNNYDIVKSKDSNLLQSTIATTTLATLLTFSPLLTLPASASHTAVDGSMTTTLIAVVANSNADLASDAVEKVINSIKGATGDVQAIERAFEDVAEMITEGKGLGGAVNYQGIQLERGYIADEDTTIYNPGLTLLTETEKTDIVQALVDLRKTTGAEKWTIDLQAGFDELRDRLDPLHMYELKGYLSAFPFYIAAIYVGVLAVQQLARGLFPVAYLVGVAAVVLPVIVIVAAGP